MTRPAAGAEINHGFEGGTPVRTMDKLSALESAVLRAIAGQHPAYAETLNAQIDHALVISRQNTGAGFYIRLSISAGPHLPNGRGPMGDIGAEIDGLAHGMGFMLWLRDGEIDELEGYSYEEDTSALDLAALQFGSVSDRRTA